jgi:DNA polymerase I-like protein with 3'-5' exonuclease and polymerase domains
MDWKDIKAAHERLRQSTTFPKRADFDNDADYEKYGEVFVDVHAETASQVLQKPAEELSEEERRVGGIVNFAALYGGGKLP